MARENGSQASSTSAILMKANMPMTNVKGKESLCGHRATPTRASIGMTSATGAV